MTIEELEPELAGYEGFAARVEAAPGLWRQAGGGIGILGILLFVGNLVQGTPRTGLYTLAGAALLAVVLTLLGGLTERRTLRPLHAAYLARGWLATQVPTGLVLDSGGDTMTVELDSMIERGRRETRTAIVLVGLARQPTEVLVVAAAARREPLGGLSFLDVVHATDAIRSQLPPWGTGDAARVFAVPEGTLLAERTGGSPFVVVIPPATRSRTARSRCYAVEEPLSARTARRRQRAGAAAR